MRIHSNSSLQCIHCNTTIQCDCGITMSIDYHRLDCSLRLFIAGNSHNGAGVRGEYNENP